MQIPTKTKCFKLMCEMKMMDHIVAHSMQVCRVATYLTDHLMGQHTHLNAKLIRSAALLHDITKTRSFNTGEDHAITGGQFLADRGYPEVGDLVRQHVVLDIYGTTRPLWMRKLSTMQTNGFFTMKSLILTGDWTISWKDTPRKQHIESAFTFFGKKRRIWKVKYSVNYPSPRKTSSRFSMPRQHRWI